MSPSSGSSQPLYTTSGRLVAVRVKSVNKHILRALLSLASASLLMRCMGLVNQVIVSAQFGQSYEMDAYVVAASIPILLAQLLASSIESSVIPVYVRFRTHATKIQVSRLFSTLINILLLGMTLFLVILLATRQQVITFSAPGWDVQGGNTQLAVSLTPIIFPVLLFMIINSFLECLLNAEGQFGWPAYLGLLVPLITVTCVLLGGASYGVLMICIGTLVGQIVQMGILYIRAHRAGFHYSLVLDLRSQEIRQIWVLAWPSLFGALISQASPLVDQMFASFLTAGSITALNNANKLLSVPVGVIFASVGRAALPYLSEQIALKQMGAFKETFRLYLWGVGLGTLVLTVFMLLFAYPLVSLLFQRGAFTAQDTYVTSMTLIGFSLGLPAMALGFFTARAFAALGKARTLMGITTFSVVANAIFDALFGRLWGSFGIALATAIVYYCNLLLLFYLLHRSLGKLHLLTPPREVIGILWKLGLGHYYVQWVVWKEANLRTFNIPYTFIRRISRFLIGCAVFSAGIAGTLYNSMLTLRIAFGSLLILVFLRYQYALLLTWIAVDTLIGSTIPFFNGNNFLSGLTLPTLLLMFVVPIKPAFKQMPALAIFFAYLMWIFLSIGFSEIGVTQFITYWLVYVAYVAIAVLMIHLLKTRKLMMGIIDAVLLQALLLSFFGIYGYFAHQNGIPDSDTGLYRTGSIFAAPPTLAFFLSMVIPLALYRTWTLKGFKVVLGLLCMLVYLATLALTFTRAADLSVPLSILVMIFFIPSKKVRIWLLATLAALATLALIVISLIDLPLLGRFLNPDLGTFNGRTLLWKALLDHFDPAHLLGYGLNSSDILLERLQVGYGRGVIGTAPHNIFIKALYETGIIGVTMLTLLLIGIPWTVIAKIRKTTGEHRLILVMVLAVFINIFIQSLFVTVVWSQQVGVYVWPILALPFVSYWSQKEKETERGMTSQGKEALTVTQEQPAHV
jgi:putative peptidoglycan lipid II flippase